MVQSDMEYAKYPTPNESLVDPADIILGSQVEFKALLFRKGGSSLGGCPALP